MERSSRRAAGNGRTGWLRRITTHFGDPGTTSRAFIDPGVWEPEQTPPEGLDFDKWLGPVPYHACPLNRCQFEFRHSLDHSGSRLTGWGAHQNDFAQRASDRDRPGPATVEASGSFNMARPCDYANCFRIRRLYANGVELICENEGGAMCEVRRLRRLEASNPEMLRQAGSGAGAHHSNWLESIRSRKPCPADAETGRRSATVCHLGNIALRLGLNP